MTTVLYQKIFKRVPLLIHKAMYNYVGMPKQMSGFACKALCIQCQQINHRASLENYFTVNLIERCCLFHTSTQWLKSKSKKGSNKVKEIIRPVDAAHILDLTEVENTMNEFLAELKEAYAKDFRVGADILLDQLEVNVEGDTYALNELAIVTKESPRLILVDMVSFPEYLNVVENYIRSSKWNLNPSVNGTIIKVPIPQATAERRATIAKSAKQRLILCKDCFRNTVRETNKFISQHEKVSKDLEHILNQQIQLYCDHYVSLADALYKGKEHEILKPSQ